MRSVTRTVLTTGAVLIGVAAAAAQAPVRPRPAVLITEMPPAPFAARSPLAAIERLVSFDANADRRISRDELPERMQGLVARGDRNADAALDPDEIRALVIAAASEPMPRCLSLPVIRGLAGRHQRPEAPAGEARTRACHRQRPQAASECAMRSATTSTER